MPPLPPRSATRDALGTAVHRVFRVLEILLATSGIFLRGLTAWRIGATVICSGLLLWTISLPHVSRTATWTAFVLVFAVRYLFLFGSFGTRGMAVQLTARFGAERGFAIYESLTALQFCLRGVTFAWFIQVTGVPLAAHGHLWLNNLGLGLVLFATAINLWSTWVIGIRSYYYGDLFFGTTSRGCGEFKARGPYRVFRNPMYGPGQAAGYGAALMAASWAGVLATALNQGAMYVFNYVYEAPHVQRMERGATPVRRYFK